MIPIELENATASAYGPGGLNNDSRSLSVDRGALTKSNSLGNKHSVFVLLLAIKKFLHSWS